jgi:hypothetical protein
MGKIFSSVAKSLASKQNNDVAPHEHPEEKTQEFDTSKLLPPDDFNPNMMFDQRNFAWMQEKMHAKAMVERQQNLENA